MLSVDETTTGLLKSPLRGAGFFLPNPGVEKEVCDGAFWTVSENEQPEGYKGENEAS